MCGEAGSWCGAATRHSIGTTSTSPRCYGGLGRTLLPERRPRYLTDRCSLFAVQGADARCAHDRGRDDRRQQGQHQCARRDDHETRDRARISRRTRHRAAARRPATRTGRGASRAGGRSRAIRRRVSPPATRRSSASGAVAKPSARSTPKSRSRARTEVISACSNTAKPRIDSRTRSATSNPPPRESSMRSSGRAWKCAGIGSTARARRAPAAIRSGTRPNWTRNTLAGAFGSRRSRPRNVIIEPVPSWPASPNSGSTVWPTTRKRADRRADACVDDSSDTDVEHAHGAAAERDLAGTHRRATGEHRGQRVALDAVDREHVDARPSHVDLGDGADGERGHVGIVAQRREHEAAVVGESGRADLHVPVPAVAVRIVEHAMQVGGERERAGQHRHRQRRRRDGRPRRYRARRALYREPHAERRRQRQSPEPPSVGDPASGARRAACLLRAAPPTLPRRNVSRPHRRRQRDEEHGRATDDDHRNVDVRPRVELGLPCQRQEEVLRAEHRDEAGDHRARSSDRQHPHEGERAQLAITHSERAQHRELRRLGERLARQCLRDRDRTGEPDESGDDRQRQRFGADRSLHLRALVVAC